MNFNAPAKERKAFYLVSAKKKEADIRHHLRSWQKVAPKLARRGRKEESRLFYCLPTEGKRGGNRSAIPHAKGGNPRNLNVLAEWKKGEGGGRRGLTLYRFTNPKGNPTKIAVNPRRTSGR